MVRLKSCAFCLVFLFLCSFSNTLIAGTTPVEVHTEPGGNIDTGTRSQWDNHYENNNGAFFWNGTRWVTNDTAAHFYFWNLSTGERLKIHHLNEVDHSTTNLGVQGGLPAGYTVTKSLYSYTKAGKTSGSYTYQAVRYEVLQPDGTTVILLSRGSVNGVNDAYFDAFMEDGKGNTYALLGDPVLFCFSGLGATQAIVQNPDINSSNVWANLPTCTPASNAQYWFDINGGSDMGGVSYHFHTQCLTSAQTANFGSGFISNFAIQFTDAEGTIQDIVFSPALASANFDGNAIPTLNTWGMLFLISGLLMLGIWAMRSSKRRQI
jgi:hypothetical protein